MIITTQFDIDDLVYFFHNDKVCLSLVHAIEAEITPKPGATDNLIIYKVKNLDGEFFGVSENLLYKNEADLFDDIRLQITQQKAVI